jgi:DNA-binding HxlR family transcriptional regulator
MSRSNTDVSVQVEAEACPVQEVLERVAGKWSILVMVAASRGPIRFTELERAIPSVSRRMLTLTLRHLERDGLMTRTVYPTVPPKVEYELTPIADELQTALRTLTGWAERHRDEIVAARQEYDGRVSER